MPVTPYAVSNGSFSKKANARTLDAQIRKIVTATETSSNSTHSPSPAAAFSGSGKRAVSASPLSKMSGIGDSTHKNVASAIFGAAALRSER